MLNPVHLRTLRVVLTAGSFADAARRLGYSPSAVSQQILTLERQLRLTLFERDARSIRPTAAAHAVAERAAPALGEFTKLDQELRLLADGTIGRLRIVSFPSASERLLPPALSALRRQRPEVEVELEEAEPHTAVEMLESADVDVALVYTYGTTVPSWARAHSLGPILEEDVLLIRGPARPGCLGDPDTPLPGLEEFADTTWMATRRDTLGAANLDRLCRDSGFEPQIRYRSNNYGVLEGLVASGLGVALVPALGLRDTGEIIVRRVEGAEAKRHVWAIAAPTVPTELYEMFVVALRRAAAGQHKHFARVSASSLQTASTLNARGKSALTVRDRRRSVAGPAETPSSS